MIIDFNNQINLQEKIYLTKSQESDNLYITYFPILKKDDIQDKKYRILKFFNLNNSENFLFKISIQIYTYTNLKLLPIGSEDIYIKVGSNNEIKKYHLYQNIHQRFINKKVGNLNFDISYKIEELYYNQIINETTEKLKQLSVYFFLII